MCSNPVIFFVEFTLTSYDFVEPIIPILLHSIRFTVVVGGETDPGTRERALALARPNYGFTKTVLVCPTYLTSETQPLAVGCVRVLLSHISETRALIMP